MKRILLFLACALFVPLAARAQNPSLSTQNFAATGSGSAIQIIGTAVKNHTLTWYPSGTVTTCTVALDSSPDGVTWTAGGVIPGLSCATNGNSSTIQSSVNYVRITVTALTGGGSITVTWAGTQALANGADCQIGPIAASTTGASPAYDNRQSGCSIWTVEEWINSTGNPTIAVQLERADDAGGTPGAFANWPAPDIENSALGALTNMQNIDFNAGQLTYYRFYPWVRVNVTTLSANTLNYQALGYRPKFGYPTTAASGAPGNDLCANPGVRKIFPINITTATTTAIAPVAGNASVYPCQGMMTVASSATTAATVLFEYGTGTACASVTKTLTGTIGAGDVPTSGGQAALVVNVAELPPSAFANGFCIVTAGTTVNVQGFFTYIQQ